MRLDAFKPQQTLIVEIGWRHACIDDGATGAACVLNRGPEGRLDSASKEALRRAVADVIKARPALAPAHLLCAIGSRGLSLRTVSVPSSVDDASLRGVLELQIEAEFPLTPSELAWGWQRIPGSSGGNQRLLIFGLRREVFQDYADALQGLAPQLHFTLTALGARGWLMKSGGDPQPHHALILSAQQIELWEFQGSCPLALAPLPLTPTSVIATSGASLVEALAHREGLRELRVLIEDEPLASAMATLRRSDSKLPITEWRTALREGGRSATTSGLRRLLTEDGGEIPLFLSAAPAVKPAIAFTRDRWRWPAIAAGLIAASLLVRYGEAFLGRPGAAKRVAEFRAYKQALPAIEKELEFLQYLERNQNYFLDTLYVVANSASPGTRLDSFNLTRRGDLSLRMNVSPATEAVNLRAKLISSGFFTNLVAEELAPSQDRQQMVVRVSAQPKPKEQRPVINPKPAPAPTNAPPGAPTPPPGAKPPSAAAPTNAPAATNATPAVGRAKPATNSAPASPSTRK